MDLAASIQAVTEEVVMRIGRHLHDTTRLPNLVLAGGVALNCVANGKLLREGPFDSIWIQPAAGDAGGALGAALFVWYQLLNQPRAADNEHDFQRGSFLGPRFDDASVQRTLKAAGAEGVETFDDEESLNKHVARMMAEGKIVGWFQGRMEFGPRALGGRSIIGDPRSPAMQATMNLKIKYRESFRPFAPCVLQEHAHEWFDLEPGQESPYMLLVAPVREEHHVPLSEEELATMERSPDLRDRVNVARSTIPAVTHVDYSARIQTVDQERNPRLHSLMTAFHELTGCPVIVNTSFNVRGEPIVCTPEDAYHCFLGTEMDLLVLGNTVVHKTEAVRAAADVQERQKYLAQFQLD
jgi:carbamoyltransferase